jgi:hypothetical protein
MPKNDRLFAFGLGRSKKGPARITTLGMAGRYVASANTEPIELLGRGLV